MGRSLNSGTLTTNGAGGATSSIVSITGTDAFAKGDPVFLNYSSGDVIKLDSVPPNLALAAGNSSDRIQSSFSGTNGASATVVVGDGGTVRVSLTYSSGSTNIRLEAFKYNAQGALIATNTLLAASASGISRYTAVATLLSDGNVGAVLSSASGQCRWYILDTNANILFSGTSSSAHAFNIQAITGGGFIFFTNTGFYRVTGAGVYSTLHTVTSFNVANNNTNGDISNEYNSSAVVAGNVRARFLSISSGGYGLFVFGTTNLSYYQFNADGSSRTSPVTVDTTGTPSLAVVATATGGNIGWVSYSSTDGARWGIVGDNGTIVLAAAGLASSDTSGTGANKANIISDTNNCFFLTWSSASQATLNLNYVSATGTAKSTWPKTSGLNSNSSARVHLLKTTAGVAAFYTNSTIFGLTVYMADTSGTVLTNGVLVFDLGGMAASMRADTWASFAVDGTNIYGFYGTSASATNGIFNVLFRVNSSGSILSVLGTDTSSLGELRGNMVITSNEIKVVAGTFTRVYRLSDMVFKGVTTAPSNLTYTANESIKSLVLGSTTYLFGTDGFLPSVFTSNGGAIVYRIKHYPTVLLGIAQTASTAGNKVSVGTKGVFNTTWNVAQTYDQSGNNPVGNKGSFAGSVATCLGLGI